MLKDPERSAILESIRLGASHEHAARAVGIAKRTLQKWMALGRKDIKSGKASIFSQFVKDVDQSRSQFITDTVAIIAEHGKKTWQARAWLGERRQPEEFGDHRNEIKRMAKQIEELSALLAKMADNQSARQPEKTS